MKKILGFVFLGALLVAIGLLTFKGSGGSTMDGYSNEKDSSQTLTVLAGKTSLHTWTVELFSKPQGYYFLQTRDAPAKGRFTRDRNAYNLKEDSGKEWKLTIQPDSSLRDESGVIWRPKSHMESSANLEENRAACVEKQGKDCPY